jgi:TonB family protein
MSLAAALLLLSVASDSDKPVDIIRSDDYPPAAKREGRQGSVGIRLTVSEQGIVLRCDVIFPSGSDDLDHQSCAKFEERARFHAAADSAGQPIAETHETVVNWVLPGGNSGFIPKRLPPNLIVTLSELPRGLKSPMIARVVVTVEAEGSLSNCKPWTAPEGMRKGELRATEKVASLVGPLACAVVQRDFKAEVALDSQGHPIRSLQTVAVQFGTKPISR